MVPLSLSFTVLTYIITTMHLDMFAEQQITVTKDNALGTASESAMLFDTSFSSDTLKRIVTVIALDDDVVQALIIRPEGDQILASSRYRHSNHQLISQPDLVQTAYRQAKTSGSYHFTETDADYFALAYPIAAISEGNTDTLDFILVIYFDKLILNNQYATYRNRIFSLSGIFLVILVGLLYVLVRHYVRLPLNTFADTIKRRSNQQAPLPVELDTNDEFSDIADEFNRMIAIENDSLAVARQATLAAQELATKKTQFLANMSHELRTPINGILGMAQLCQQTDSEKQRDQYIQHLTESSKLLLSVVNDILDFSKLSDHTVTLHEEDTALSQLILQVANMIQVLASEKQLDFSAVLSEACPYSVKIDAQRTQQILLNLLNNAIKFTSQGQVALNADFKWQDKNNGDLILSISDTGIGIAPEKMHSLFDPFEQADTSISRNYGGTGLGLAISKELLDIMQGEIKAISTPGQGSLFRVVIPCQAKSFSDVLLEKVAAEKLPTILCDKHSSVRIKSLCQAINDSARGEQSMRLEVLDENWHKPPYILNEERLLNQLQQPTCVTPSFKENQDSMLTKGRILLVEDNEINAMVAKTMLENLGQDVVVAPDGQVAVDTMEEREFDLVLMDIQMPVMDGYQATVEIRKRHISVPIIALSANVMQEDIDKAYAVGMSDYLNKPVILDALETSLKKHLAG